MAPEREYDALQIIANQKSFGSAAPQSAPATASSLKRERKDGGPLPWAAAPPPRLSALHAGLATKPVGP